MSRITPPTLTETFSWDSASQDAGKAVPNLVICWSLDEPDRIGEAAAIAGRCVLGRGGLHARDAAPRVIFHRQRPWGSVPTPPLMGSRISRIQLEVTPAEDGRLLVRSVGRCAMLVRGAAVEQAELAPGDTLVLRDALVLLAVQRRPFRASPRGSPDASSFPFGRPDPNGVIGESPAAWALRDDLSLAAQSGQHVLLLGQSGTGKELAARAIHALSPRSHQALIARNASTFPEGLVDAELFGAAKGYPNAGTPERPGLIGEADGGTLFLDEIGELPAHLSSHLLRVLDRDGEYQRLGESRVRRSNLRVVAATNRPVEHLKQDFAARFAVRVRIPGFEERREDIPLLIRHLLFRAAETSPTADHIFERRSGALAEPRVDSLLVDNLVRHRYTLHTRELERLLWVALASSHGNFLALTPELGAELHLAPAAEPPPPAVEPRDAERRAIDAALSAARGNVTEAAQQLGLKNRYALYRLMKRHGIAAPGDQGSEA
jgi:transcriptional regulator with AAA-type ATPase domain